MDWDGVEGLFEGRKAALVPIGDETVHAHVHILLDANLARLERVDRRVGQRRKD